MTSQRTDDTDPIVPPAEATEPGTAAPAASRTDPGLGSLPEVAAAALPPIPYEVETRNDDVNRLLRSRIAPSRAPRAVDAPTTDGELAAQYQAAPRVVLPGTETPVPQPKVMLGVTAELPVPVPSRTQVPTLKITRSRPAAEESARAPAPPVVVPTDDSTYVPPPRRSRTLLLAALACVAVIAIGAGVLLHTSQAVSPAPTPSAEAMRSSAIPPVTPPAPPPPFAPSAIVSATASPSVIVTPPPSAAVPPIPVPMRRPSATKARTTSDEPEAPPSQKTKQDPL